MTDAEKYVAVFRAAAEGVTKPYEPLVWVMPLDGRPGRHESQSDPEGYVFAKTMAGAFNAIADVFQSIVDADSE